MNDRGHAATRPDPGAFRCLVCKVYVHGTASGHCPRCGFIPPSAPAALGPPRSTYEIAIAIAILVVILVAVR